MKNLFDYLTECGGMATPGNTAGMGNPAAPAGGTLGTPEIDPSTPGSGDLFTAKVKRKKKHKVDPKMDPKINPKLV